MSYKINKHVFKKRPKLLLLLVGVVVLSLVGCSYYFLVIKNNKSVVTNPVTDGKEKVNLSPPTEAELRETEKFKKDLADNQQSSSSPNQSAEGLQLVTPVIGYLQQSENGGNIESNGHIPGVVESGGTCTLTLEKDSVKIAESHQAMMDAQGMICGHIIINRDKLSAGTWKAKLSYLSSTRKGSSEEKSIEVK